MELKTVAQSVLNPGFPGLIGTSQGYPSLCLLFYQAAGRLQALCDFFCAIPRIRLPERYRRAIPDQPILRLAQRGLSFGGDVQEGRMK